MSKIGLVLGGGGARGFALLGVVKALYEKNIFPDMISGVSAGALAGAFLADGKTPDTIHELFKHTKFFSFPSIHLPMTGLMSIDHITKAIEEHISVKDLQDLRTPFFAAASNLNAGRIEYFNRGPLSTIITASASIPVVFAPVKINGDLYADGGVFDNLPVAPLLGKCDKIIAVHVSPFQHLDKIGNLVQIATRTFHLMVGASTEHIKQKCDVLIEPRELTKFEIWDVSKADEMYAIGYEHAKKMEILL